MFSVGLATTVVILESYMPTVQSATTLNTPDIMWKTNCQCGMLTRRQSADMDLISGIPMAHLMCIRTHITGIQMAKSMNLMNGHHYMKLMLLLTIYAIRVECAMQSVHSS